MYQMLSQIPETGPWTAYVGLHPSVQNEAKESELQDLFHDGEKIRVERVRIVLHRDTGNVRSVFIDFMDAESLRNALHLRTSFHERPVKVEIAASREPKRPERPERVRRRPRSLHARRLRRAQVQWPLKDGSRKKLTGTSHWNG